MTGSSFLKDLYTGAGIEVFSLSGVIPDLIQAVLPPGCGGTGRESAGLKPAGTLALYMYASRKPLKRYREILKGKQRGMPQAYIQDESVWDTRSKKLSETLPKPGVQFRDKSRIDFDRYIEISL